MSNSNSTPKRGYDSWVDNDNPHTEHGSGDWVQLRNSLKRGYVWLPIPAEAMGRTVASAILTGHAHGALVAQTFTLQGADGPWQAGKINWANQPGVTGAIATAVIGATADGGEVAWDITTLAQAVVSGTMVHNGWRISTSYATTAQKFAAFGSGESAWKLAIEYSEDPEPPTALAPDGTVVAAAKPVVTCDFTDFGGDGTDMAAMQVQVDIGNNGSTDWDSGLVAAVAPIMDLAAQGMTGTVSAGTVVAWRVAVEDEDGNVSDFSDWATYTYQPQPTLTIDSPAGGVMFDPTSDVLAHISTANLAAFRILVTDGDDRTQVRYDTGKRKATDPSDIALALPLKNSDGTNSNGGSRIFTDDADYQIIVRSWDSYDRQSTPATATGGRLPVYVEASTTIHFDDDLALDPITSYQLTQVDATPFVKHTWTDLAAGDAYVISRDSEQIARLEPADTISGPDTFTWVDVTAAPYVQHVYEIRRLTVGVGRSAPVRQAITVRAEGIWLLRDNGDSVMMKGPPSDTLQIAERRATWKPLHVPYTVSQLTAFEGISGPFDQTWIDDDFASAQTVHQAKRVLDAIKDNTGEIVRLIFAGFSKPVSVTDITVLPHADFTPLNNKHRVVFNVSQTGEFDHRLTSGG